MAKRGTRVAKTDAQRADDFKRIAAKKVNTIAKACKQLGGMASPKYRYTPAEVKQLAEFVQAEVEAAFDSFEGKKASATGFAFK